MSDPTSSSGFRPYSHYQTSILHFQPLCSLRGFDQGKLIVCSRLLCRGAELKPTGALDIGEVNCLLQALDDNLV